MNPLTQNYFELFQLPMAFEIDSAALDSRYRRLQAETHPDKFAGASDAERQLSLQLSARINEAHRALKNPLLRAAYLLSLSGVDAFDESNTAMPTDFLMRQLEWRERIESADADKNIGELKSLDDEARNEKESGFAELKKLLTPPSDAESAAALIRQLKYFEKMRDEIARAIESAED